MAFKHYNISTPPNWDEFTMSIGDILSGKFVSFKFLIGLNHPFFSFAGCLGINKDLIDGSILKEWGSIISGFLTLVLAGIAFIPCWFIFKSQR